MMSVPGSCYSRQMALVVYGSKYQATYFLSTFHFRSYGNSDPRRKSSSYYISLADSLSPARYTQLHKV